MKKGQGTFEYVLLLGGVLLIVVLAIVVLQNTATSGMQGASSKSCTARLINELPCIYANGSWKECGQIDSTTFKECGSVGPIAGCNSMETGKKYCGTKVFSS